MESVPLHKNKLSAEILLKFTRKTNSVQKDPLRPSANGSSPLFYDRKGHLGVELHDKVSIFTYLKCDIKIINLNTMERMPKPTEMGHTETVVTSTVASTLLVVASMHFCSWSRWLVAGT